MTAAPLVSVVIPAWRAEATIARALASALAQDGCGEAIVIVDGAGDRTGSIVADHRDPRVRLVVRTDNRGAQRTRNEGLALAAHPLVMFLDSDDFLEGALLAGLRETIGRQDADIGFGPMQILREQRGIRDPLVVPDYASAADLFMRWFVDRRFVAPCSVVWRASFLRAIGGWDEAIRKNQDGEVVLRAVLGGARFALSARGRGVYVLHGRASISKSDPDPASLLSVSEKILAMPTGVIADDLKTRACAIHDYKIAWGCFEGGHEALGEIALARSRALGFHGHYGPLRHRLAGALLGLRRKSALVRAGKRLLAARRRRAAAP